MAPLRILAPAGAPLTLGVLAQWLTGGGPTLDRALAAAFGPDGVFLTSTGRAGMTLLLQALRLLSRPDCNEVAIPGYSCYSVAASVARAGLVPRLVDVTPGTTAMAPERLEAMDWSRVMAVVTTNLYGLPDDLPSLQAIASAHGVFLVDDAAQSMGATVGGQPSGTWGDAGLFSFDKGKPVAAIDGGAVLTQSPEVSRAMAAATAALPTPTGGQSAVHVVKGLAYWAMLRPWIYWLPARLPGLGLGRTVFTIDYPLGAIDPALAALAAAALPRLDELVAQRRRTAAALSGALRQLSCVSVMEPLADARPSYLRFPVLLRTPALRASAFELLQAQGLGASTSYPKCLADVPEVRAMLAPSQEPVDAARDVAGRVLTLPTHPFVTATDVQRIADCLTRLDEIESIARGAARVDEWPTCVE